MNVPYNITGISLNQPLSTSLPPKPPPLFQKERYQTHHNGIPLIPSRITAENHKPRFLIHNHILTVPNFVLQRDLMGGEVVDVFDESGMVSDH